MSATAEAGVGFFECPRGHGFGFSRGSLAALNLHLGGPLFRKSNALCEVPVTPSVCADCGAGGYRDCYADPVAFGWCDMCGAVFLKSWSREHLPGWATFFEKRRLPEQRDSQIVGTILEVAQYVVEFGPIENRA